MRLTNPTPIMAADSGIDALMEHHAWASRMPEDTRWYQAVLPASEVRTLIHIVAPLWAELSDSTGLVGKSAQAIDQSRQFTAETSPHANAIREIADRFDGERLSRMIFGANDLNDGPIMVLDGNHRAVALELMRLRGTEPFPEQLPVVVALSRSVRLNSWAPQA